MAFSALEALQAFGAGRQMALQDQERQRDRQLREGLVSAYDTTTGQIDPQAARQAYAGAGDIGGAMQFDRSRLQNVDAELENNRDRLIMGAQLLANVNDESSYQAALQIGRQNGIDIEGVPPNFDPSYVQGVVQLGTRLAQAGRAPQQPTSFQRDYEFIRERNPELAETYFRNQAEGSPVVFDMNGDGAPDLVPRSYFNQQGAGQDEVLPPPTRPGEIRNGYRYRGGPVGEQSSWEPVEGGAGGNRPQTFP